MSSKQIDLPAPESMGYEDAKQALIEIVRRLENGQASLEETVRWWETGEALAERCEHLLDQARTRLGESGEPTSDTQVESVEDEQGG